MNLMCSGGSSRVFSIALNAEVESMWTSSMTYTLNRPRAGEYTEFSRSWRISSTLVLVAASTSIRSTKRPASISTQAEHFPQGLELMPVSQFRHFARIRARVVLPTPRVPENKYAWCRRFWSSALRSALTTCSCPTSDSNVRGRHLRARTW